jgi:hypothetical protein
MPSPVLSRDFRQGERLFQPLNDFIIIAAALIYACRSTTDEPVPIREGMNLELHSHNIGVSIVVPLSNAIQFALGKDLPDFIAIGMKQKPDPIPLSKVQTPATDAVMLHLIAPIFLMFFERYNEWLTANQGDAANWPEALNFARLVRNSIAHGKINIRNPRALPVKWRGFSYSAADNGRKIIGPDLRVADILYLMFEADEELDRLNAPAL